MKMNLIADQHGNVFFTKILFYYLKNHFLNNLKANHNMSDKV